MRRPKKDIQLTSYDELLGLEETSEKSMNQVVEIELEKLYPFKNHPINFSQDITSYTAKGREKIHKSVQCVETQELRNVMKYRNPNESIEFNDNSISAYLVQQGNCYVMGNRLNVHQMKCIRKIPVGEGGTDKHTNIAFISEEIWRAVMTEDISETIRIMKKFNMDDKQRRRFNRLRENYGLLPIKKR